MNNKRQRNKLFTILMLVIALLIPQWGWAQETSKPTVGTGTKSDPYEISTAAELAWFRDDVNVGNVSKCAKLTANIDLKDFCHAADASNNTEELSWDPIGNDSKQYAGTFDGDGHTISNLYIKVQRRGVGFFGYMKGTIKNIIFDNAQVENTGNNYNYPLTGIVVGAGFGTLQNLKTLKNCSVKSSAKTLGGIAGAITKSCSNLENNATVSGVYEVGGIAGSFDTSYTISSCVNNGAVTDKSSGQCGGIVGFLAHGTIEDCANYGNIIGTKEIGGIVGYAQDNAIIKSTLSCGNITTSQESRIGIIIGYARSLKASNMLAYSNNAKLTINGTIQEGGNIKTVGDGNLTIDEGSTLEEIIKGFTQEQLKSGAVTFLLNGSKSTGSLAWYQKLGENGDANPVLNSTGDNIVYHGTQCDKKTDVYTNDNSIFGEDGAIPHNYEIANVADANGLYGDVCTECNANNESVKYIQNFCGEWGNNVKLSVEADGSYRTADVVKINDVNAYDSPVDFTAHKLEYTREYLGDNKWQAVYVPFETQATDWIDNGITVASINNFHEYEKEDGSGYETVLEVKKATSGVFEANTPYVVRSGESGNDSKTITIDNVKLYKAESKNYYCMSMTRKYDFTGIYTPQSGLGQDESVAVYALDKQGRIAPLKSETTLGAQRWYLTISDRNGSSLPQNTKSRTIRIDMIGEGATTGIKDVQVITCNETDNIAKAGIYDLQGRKLSKEPTHGIYIKNGKKYVK